MYRYELVGREYDSGVSADEIAAKYHISKASVWDYASKWRKKHMAETTERKHEFLNANYIRGAWNMTDRIEELKKLMSVGECYGFEIQPEDLRENQEATYNFLKVKHKYPYIVEFEKPDGSTCTMTWFEIAKSYTM